MHFGLKISLAAMMVCTALAGCTSTQPSDQTTAASGFVNEGTLAETANTTALATSTYHQPTGFLPGMKP